MSTIRSRTSLTRRRLLTAAAASVLTMPLLGGLAAPRLSRAADRPQIARGIQSGDVSIDRMVWARADRAARMQVECSTVESFKTIIRAAGRCVAGQRLHRQSCCSKACRPGRIFSTGCGSMISRQRRLSGETQVGHFRTAPATQRSISFVWSGDTAGQGWGIDPARGGMRSYRDHAAKTGRISSSIPAITSTPIVRSPSELKLPDGEHLAQHRHRGEIRGRPQPRAVSRQL